MTPIPQALAARLHVPDDAAGRRIAGNHRPGAMLAVHTRLLAAAAGHLDALQQQRMAAQMCDLTALALGATLVLRERRRDICRAARRQQILAYIETHLRDSNLSDVRAARALGISRRWLHALFDEGGRSFAAWVTQRRLEESRKLLDSPDRDELSITHIALESGFNDLSTFNRRFRRHYLITPRQARRSRRSGQPEKR